MAAFSAVLLLGLLAGVSPVSDREFDVRSYGATGRRSENATRAIQAAIDACTTAGGGVVMIGPGEYTTGRVHLKDNVELRLEAGATLLMSQDRADFANGARSIIYANGARNIAVTGRGKLAGLARYEWLDFKDDDPEIAKELEIARKAGVEMKRYYRDPTAVNCFMFVLDDCEDIRLQDVTVVNSPLWNIRLNDCNRVFIRGVHIYSDLEKGVNSDGIDIVSTSNVVISDSIIVTGDDAVVLKTIARNGRAKPVENVTVTNCILTSSSAAMMIGTETEADIRHVIFSNCVVRDSNKGFGINVQDGAVVSDVIVSNITMDLRRRHVNWWGDAEAFKLVLKKRKPESRLGEIRDIVIDNVVAQAQGTSTLTGHADRRLANIRISDLRLLMEPESTKDKRATDAISVNGVNDLCMRNIRVQWPEDTTEPMWKSALGISNVTGFDLDGFRGRQGLIDGPSPAIDLNDVVDGVVRDSVATEGCGTFLRIQGTKTKNVTQRNNDTGKARLGSS